MHPDLRAIATQPHGLISIRAATTFGLEHRVRESLREEEVIRLRRGVYAEKQQWRSATANARHVLRIRAFALTHDGEQVFSHQSAAALWGMPTIGEWPAVIHVAALPSGSGRTKSGLHEHVLPDGVTMVMHDGQLVTSVADTVVALAGTLPFAAAVAIADFALHVPRGGTALCTRVDLTRSLQTYAGRKGYRAARAVVEFADGLSGSLGESHSRANMKLCGFVIPELQVPFSDADGFIGYTDFFWRTINRIGEFDGLGKYLREEFARGKDPAQVVIEEKIREDRLRGCGPSVSRWLFRVGVSPRWLGDLLHRVGVPLAR